MIHNPTLKQLVKAAEEGKRVKCSNCDCGKTKMGYRIGKLSVDYVDMELETGPAIMHGGETWFPLATNYHKDRGGWMWNCNPAEISVKSFRKNLVILDEEEK